MAKFIKMYNPQTGDPEHPATVDENAYEKLWKPKGWVLVGTTSTEADVSHDENTIVDVEPVILPEEVDDEPDADRLDEEAEYEED